MRSGHGVFSENKIVIVSGCVTGSDDTREWETTKPSCIPGYNCPHRGSLTVSQDLPSYSRTVFRNELVQERQERALLWGVEGGELGRITQDLGRDREDLLRAASRLSLYSMEGKVRNRECGSRA